MEIKAKDMCPRCKYCLCMTPQGMYSCGYADDGSELNIGIDVILSCANFEWKDGKIEGKVRDICPNCKNHKSVTSQCDAKKDLRIIEVKCEDPYDGMVKTLDADSDICCSLFEPKSDRSCDKISLLQHELEMDKLRRKINELEKEKAAHMKGIERLKKSQEKLQNQIKNLQTTNEESYKREDELEKKIHALQKECNNWEGDYERLRNYLLFPICEVLYGDKLHEYNMLSDIVKDIKDLKVQSDENGTLYEDLEYWKERCHKAETDVTTLNSKVDVLENKLRKTDSIRDAVWNEKELKQKISDLTESNENLTKMVERRDRWVDELKGDIDTLQNECLAIAEIAKRAYDESNRD